MPPTDHLCCPAWRHVQCELSCSHFSTRQVVLTQALAKEAGATFINIHSSAILSKWCGVQLAPSLCLPCSCPHPC